MDKWIGIEPVHCFIPQLARLKKKRERERANASNIQDANPTSSGVTAPHSTTFHIFGNSTIQNITMSSKTILVKSGNRSTYDRILLGLIGNGGNEAAGGGAIAT